MANPEWQAKTHYSLKSLAFHRRGEAVPVELTAQLERRSEALDQAAVTLGRPALPTQEQFDSVEH